MKRPFIKISAIFLLASNSMAQNYDSTGNVRLWAPNPSPSVNPPPSVDIPGYGKYPEGSIIAVYSGKQYPVTTFYACIARSGGGGGSPIGAYPCPYNTIYMITASGVYHDGGGSDGG